MLKERMTPEEIAQLTGYSRQTINKWVRKEGWITSPRPGVQGGKARVVHINEQVKAFIHSAQRVCETTAPYMAQVNDSTFQTLMLTMGEEMSEAEQKQLTSMLLREGISGVLQRLGIRG